MDLANAIENVALIIIKQEFLYMLQLTTVLLGTDSLVKDARHPFGN